MKIYLVFPLIFSVVYSTSILSIKTIGKNFPDYLQDIWKEEGPEVTQELISQDALGRDHIEICAAGYAPDRFAIHQDEEGVIWFNLIDEETEKDIPLVNVKMLDGTIFRYLPETFDRLKLKNAIDPERVMYPSKNAPRFQGFTSDRKMYPKTSEKLDGEKESQKIIDFDQSENTEYDICDDYSVKEEGALSTENHGNGGLIPVLVSGTFIGLAVYTGYYMLYNVSIGARYLYRDDLWSAWNSEEGYDILLTLEPKDISDKLVQDIKVVYYDEQNPIKCFLEDVRGEYDTLLQWLQFRNMARTLRLPVGQDFYKIEKRLALLELMRKAAKCWRAQQLAVKIAS